MVILHTLHHDDFPKSIKWYHSPADAIAASAMRPYPKLFPKDFPPITGIFGFGPPPFITRPKHEIVET